MSVTETRGIDRYNAHADQRQIIPAQPVYLADADKPQDVIDDSAFRGKHELPHGSDQDHGGDHRDEQGALEEIADSSTKAGSQQIGYHQRQHGLNRNRHKRVDRSMQKRMTFGGRESLSGSFCRCFFR